MDTVSSQKPKHLKHNNKKEENMKTFRWLVLGVVIASFIVGLGFTVRSEPIKSRPDKVYKIYPCPAGWHRKANTGSEKIACIPDQPTMPCPEGWVYYFTGCEVGCYKPAEPPK